ncbi:MAG: aspartate/glutamate racemase family protein, partial [Selenomonadaceae bacterium]|nr:aspartate/glutamate racemase family protein [Selenomonadaceae bacterium]
VPVLELNDSAVAEEYLYRAAKKAVEEDGAQAIVLGCTELPLVLNDEVSPVPCLDSMQIHINAIVREILRDE